MVSPIYAKLYLLQASPRWPPHLCAVVQRRAFLVALELTLEMRGRGASTFARRLPVAI